MLHERARTSVRLIAFAIALLVDAIISADLAFVAIGLEILLASSTLEASGSRTNTRKFRGESLLGRNIDEEIRRKLMIRRRTYESF